MARLSNKASRVVSEESSDDDDGSMVRRPSQRPLEALLSAWADRLLDPPTTAERPRTRVGWCVLAFCLPADR